MALLNAKLADWYFRLGSTNAHVSHYQLYNLPCPVFAEEVNATDHELLSTLTPPLQKGDVNAVFDLLAPHLQDAPFSLAIREAIILAVRRIVAIESQRGEIARSARSALDPAAQPYQDLIDRLLFAMAGLSPTEAAALEQRLSTML